MDPVLVLRQFDSRLTHPIPSCEQINHGIRTDSGNRGKEGRAGGLGTSLPGVCLQEGPSLEKSSNFEKDNGNHQLVQRQTAPIQTIQWQTSGWRGFLTPWGDFWGLRTSMKAPPGTGETVVMDRLGLQGALSRKGHGPGLPPQLQTHPAVTVGATEGKVPLGS